MIKLFEAFAGIGAQHKALKLLKKEKIIENYEINAISEWDYNALIAYDAINNGNLSVCEVDNYLEKFNLIDYLNNNDLKNKIFSADGKTPKNNIFKINKKLLKRLIVANKRTNNLGSITQIKAQDLKKIDFNMITYSFPCQDLSVASMGRGKGMKKADNTRSGLLWEIERILRELKTSKIQLPKFLLLENVPALLNQSNIEDYNDWLNTLKNDFNYKTWTLKLNARDFNNPQNRVRVFGISVHKKLGALAINKIQNDIKKFIHESNGDDDLALEKYIVSTFGKDKNKTNDDQWRRLIIENYLNLDKNNFSIDEYEAIPNDTPSRMKMYKDNCILNETTTMLSTLTTKQDRNPNAGSIDIDFNFEGKSKFRFISAKEAYKLMGFSEEDYCRAKNEYYLNIEHLYKQAGNSIVVHILKAIFNYIDILDRED